MEHTLLVIHQAYYPGVTAVRMMSIVFQNVSCTLYAIIICDAHTQRTTLLPVPPVMRGEEKSTGQGYLTTNRIYHSYQPHDTVLTHPPNDRATACYRAHHNENFTYKVSAGREYGFRSCEHIHYIVHFNCM